MKKITISIIMFLILLGISNISNAGIEIKSGTTAYVNVNVSESFDLCYNLRDGSSTLGTCSLDPHLTTSLDWGAVAYLAQSRYGVNNSTLSTNTTGNKTGIMNMNGKIQTATMFSDRETTTTAANTYRYRLEEALKDSNLAKYVNLISKPVDIESTKGMAMAETAGWYGAEYAVSNQTYAPMVYRSSLLGVYYHTSASSVNQGQPNSTVGFRPVIWN